MRAKKYLEQIRKLDIMIQNKMSESKRWMDMAHSVTVSSDGEKVQSSGNHNKMADAICKYVDLEAEINRLIDERCDIIQTIEHLETVEYDVLYKIYVQYLKLDEVAAIYEKSYSWVTSVHGRALENVRKLVEAEKDNERMEHTHSKT